MINLNAKRSTVENLNDYPEGTRFTIVESTITDGPYEVGGTITIESHSDSSKTYLKAKDRIACWYHSIAREGWIEWGRHEHKKLRLELIG